MFSITSRRTLWFCEKVITRDLRTRRLVPANPGMDNRIKAFREEGLQIQDNDAEEFIEQSASDFHNVGEEYHALLNETLIDKQKLRYHIIKEKYFKENMPNLLTWSEKEQIRHLITTNPEEWTPERIAESFPVTVQVVKKFMKYPWKPATEERIARHDASAMRNWRELKEGTFNIPEDLRQHFLKFSDRKIPPLRKESVKKFDITPEKIGEYEQIVRKCASKEHNETFQESEQETRYKDSKHKVHKDKKRMTLEELTNKIKNRMDKEKDVNISDQMILNSVSIQNHNDSISKEITLEDDNAATTKLTKFKPEDKNVLQERDYPERIRIPKKAYKKGATYKINDCFYDHDGKFLYRVIGLENLPQN